MSWDLALKAMDTISGQYGAAYASIDGNTEKMLYLKKIEATVEKTKKEIKVLGYSGTKNKSTGWKGTGTATLYYITSLYRKYMLRYMNTGQDFNMDLYIENEDPSSDAGKQKIWLKNVNFDKIILAKLDVDSTELDEEVSFTFDGAEILNEFDEVEGE